MEEHKFSDADPSEPEDGWQAAPELETSPILSIALCRYTGFIIDSMEQGCDSADTHPPGPCITIYHSADALTRGEIDIANFPPDVVIVRADMAAGDATGATHA